MRALANKSQSYYGKHFEVIAKAECREICQAMFDNLPRELRDMVYHALLFSMDKYRKDNVSVQKLTSSSGTALQFHTKSSPYHSQQTVRSHIWDEAFVTKPVKGEVLNRWHRTMHFHFEESLETLGLFLSSYQLNLRQKVCTVISRISIMISFPLDRQYILSNLEILAAVVQPLHLAIELCLSVRLSGKMTGRESIRYPRFQEELLGLYGALPTQPKDTVTIVVSVPKLGVRLEAPSSTIEEWLKSFETTIVSPS
jgi:hypothetical protein